MVQTIFILILIIVTADFIFERVLSFLNVKNAKKPIPDLLDGIYSNEQYEKQQSYFRTNTRFGQLTSTYSFIIILCMYAFGGFGWLDEFLQNRFTNPMVVTLLFFGILFISNDILSIPFEIYDTT